MARVTKTIGFSVPPPVRKEVEQMAKEERRTKSELFREMVRVYKRYRTQREQDEEAWVSKLIQEAQEEERLRPLTPEELRKEDARLARYGEQQAKKLGIKPKDLTRVIHEHRTQRRA